MDTEKKFQTALKRIAEERDLELVVEYEWANTGWYSFQPRDGFEPILRFPFNFQHGYSSFDGGARLGILGSKPGGGAWRGVRGGEHDHLLARIVEILDLRLPGTVRIIVLPDGETYGPLEGCRVYEIPSWFDAEAIEEALAADSLEGRELR